MKDAIVVVGSSKGECLELREMVGEGGSNSRSTKSQLSGVRLNMCSVKYVKQTDLVSSMTQVLSPQGLMETQKDLCIKKVGKL